LFEREELNDAGADGRMKTQTSFVRTERAVHLDAEPAIDLNLTFVVDPRNAELDHALWLHQALKNLSVPIFLVTLDDRPDRFQHFGNGLKELRLIWIALFNNFENLLHEAHKGVISAGYLPPGQIKRTSLLSLDALPTSCFAWKPNVHAAA
jgi:hypothetical protein